MSQLETENRVANVLIDAGIFLDTPIVAP
jgi:hypothetical protein